MIEHLHRVAAHAYHCGEIDVGRRCCERLLRLPLSAEKEEKVRGNRTWYTQTLSDQGVAAEFTQIDVPPARVGWSLFNPSGVSHSGRLLVNAIAPRPHNSGHLTIDACVTSQFEQQVRAVCGLSLGDTTQIKPAAMVNLLGDLWVNGEPDWAAALAMPGVKLHLYGKGDPRVGRKMGHITALGDTVDEAAAKALAARDVLC